jgi:hypothetical protein
MNKTLHKVFEVYVFAFLFLIASKPPNDADLWFYLNTGEYIVQNGQVPTTEFSSFTHFGSQFVAYGWLSGLLFYVLFKYVGLHALTFVTALIAAISFWIIFRHSRAHPLIAGSATVLAIWASTPTLGVKPRVLTLLFAAIFLVLLRKYARTGEAKSVFWLVPLMVLWVNLHGGFLVGLALIGFTIIGIPLDGWIAGEKIRILLPRIRTLVVVFIACLVAGLINPYGLAMYTFPLRMLASPVFQESVADWVSPNFHNRQLWPLLGLIIASIVVLVSSPKRPRPSELLLFIAMLYSTLRTNRNMVIFALVAAPLLAEHLNHIFSATSFGRHFGKEPARATSRHARLFAVLLLLPLLAFIWRLRATVYGPANQQLLQVPVNAVEYMRKQQITGNTFTDPNVWGAFVSWSLRSNPVYIDGRDVYSAEFVSEYIRIIRGNSDWREPFSRYGVEVVMIRPDSMLARELNEAGWPRVYEDKMVAVFKRP